MTTDISNKTLSIYIIVAICVSTGGILLVLEEEPLMLTGRASSNQSGLTNFSVTSLLSIKFAGGTAIQFGTGYVNDTGGAPCQIGTNQTINACGAGTVNCSCIGFNSSVTAGERIYDWNLTIENNGNILANVSLNFSKNASLFINGSLTAPSFKYNVTQNESASCGTINSTGYVTGMKEVNTTDDVTIGGTRICQRLNTTDTNDSIKIALWLSIPKDAPTGVHTTAMYAVGCDDGSC
jgi:hypothetical protein